MGEAVMTTRRQADGAIVVDVRGTLDAATVDALREALLSTLHAERPVTMIVDLTFVTFMDSMGIGALVTGYNAARETGTRFVLRNPSEFVHRQLRVTGLAEMFGLPPASPGRRSRTPPETRLPARGRPATVMVRSWNRRSGRGAAAPRSASGSATTINGCPRVRLRVRRAVRDPRASPTTRRTRTWELRLPRPPVRRIEYKLELVHPDGGTETVCDPDNPRRVGGGFGDSSVLWCPDYREPGLAAPARRPPGDWRDV